MKKVGVLRFPGTNCDRDIWKSLERKNKRPDWIWYQDSFDPEAFDAYVIPGGFSYGDYLRSGALAALSAAMESLKKAAERGKPILGICNGFQILCEAGLLPGVFDEKPVRAICGSLDPFETGKQKPMVPL